MKLGLSMRYLGYHDAAWRHPEVPPGGATDFKYFLNSARIAERGKFDMVFFADGIGIRARRKRATTGRAPSSTSTSRACASAASSTWCSSPT
jgi:alkanesulfonate monooxygenase SsuD/methylene tetrahydromethanopterin reductase-like flavin-dependent oxidoreductase (luciferase family)